MLIYDYSRKLDINFKWFSIYMNFNLENRNIILLNYIRSATTNCYISTCAS